MSPAADRTAGRWLPAAAWALVVAGLLEAEPASRSRPASRPADPPLARQKDICFGAGTSPAVKTFRRAGIVLWTDAPGDGKGLLGHLEAVERHLRSVLPTTRPASRPVALAVYARRGDYLDLWRRVGAHYHGRFGRIETDGYSYRVFCATSYDTPKRFQPRRSVLCHEFTHVWLYQRLGLRNDGNWLTEGIANAVQLHFFPEAGDRRDFARWLDTGRMLPLKRLMDQPRIEPKDYWQAATLVELLARRHRRRLPEVVAAFNRRRSAYRIVTEVLQTDFASLGRQWADDVHAAAAAAPRRR